MIIKTKRLNIYPASDEQMEKLIAEQTVPELKDAYTQMLFGCKMHPNSRQWYAVWNIELNDKNETLVGNLSFKGLKDGITEIGYGMNSEYEGQGFMTEAVTAVVKWAAKKKEVKLIEAETEETNEASKRVLEKSGFIPNGKTGAEGPRYVWKGCFIIRKLKESEIKTAHSLAFKVFSEYESPDYSDEGTEEFKNCLNDKEYLKGIEYYGAFDGEKLIGMVGIRKEKGHICFFFVDGEYQRLGIGTRLFESLKTEYSGKTITLNSSPYGLPFYKSLGFFETDSEQTVNGIKFTPMQFKEV